jgi:actin-related protein
VETVLTRCEPSRRVLLWENIVLTGGCSEIRNFQARLESEILGLCAMSETSNEYQAKEIKFAQIPEYMTSYKEMKSNVAMLGGSIVGKVMYC